MKKIVFTIVALSVASFTLVDTKTMITKSWQVLSVNAITDGIAQLKAALAKPGISETDKAEFNKQLNSLKAVDVEMKKSVFTFKADGTYSVTGFQPEKGKWSLSKDQKMLFTTKENTTIADTAEIVKITDQDLKLSQKTPSGAMIIDFKASLVKK